MKHSYLKHVLLCLCLFAGINVFAYDAEIDGIYYNFSGDEATVTSGNWGYYSGSLTIPSSVTHNGKTYSVTSIGDRAFAGCTGLTSITIPSSVTSIGNSAFYGCSSLTSLTIPGSVTSIGDWAFSSCYGLTEVTIPNSVTSIGENAFSGCSGLTSITIPNSVTSIEAYTFQYCSGLTSITIPNSVTSIGVRAFSYCNGLTSITIPESVTSIGSGAFSDCSSLTSITIPNSVTSIGTYAFYICTSLTSVNIPGSVTSIGNYAFQYCSGLTSVNIPNSVTSIGQSAFQGCSSLTSVTIPNSVTSIGSYAFSGCSGLTSITIPESVTSIEAYTFQYCSGLTSITIPNSVTSIGVRAFSYCNGLTSITIPNNVTSIGRSAFDGCYFTYDAFVNNSTLTSDNNWGATLYDGEETSDGLFIRDGVVVKCRPCATSVTIPNSVTSIGDWAFGGCTGLTSIIVESGNTVYDSRNNCNAIIETATNTLIVGCMNTNIPNSVTSIGDRAFAGCTGLTSITIPNSVTSIGNSAFYNCSGLTSVTIPGSVTSISEGAFSSCYGLTSVTIPGSVTSISEGAFSSCYGLTSVNIPNSVTSIGENAFSGCSGLTSVNIPNSVTSIGENAFSGCSGLTSITIPNSVTSIEAYTFDGCSGLTSITIPNSVTSIGVRAFSYCNGLTSITIPNNVTSIGNSVFYGCSGLTSITIPDGVTSIDYQAFYGCSGLSSVTIPNSVTIIGQSAFQGCSSLTSVTIPNSVTSIGSYVFKACTSLTSLKVKNPTPISITKNAFGGRASITLYVPEGSKTAYMAAPYWSEFKEIIEYVADELYLEDVEGVTGKRLILPIALENDHQITGLQMDLYLPEGMTVARNSRGKMMVSCTERMDGNYTVTGQEMEGGFVRIAGFSPDNDAFTGSDGDILNVTIDIDESVSIGDYTIQLKDIVLSDANNIEHHPDDAEATVKVLYALGDADGSGTVNINDVVCIVNHILNRDTGTFLEKAADVDDSGSININDVVVLIDRYILHRKSAVPQHTSRLMADAADITDRLYLDDLDIMAGETVEIAVKLSNTHDVRAVQGNIKLPDGFFFVTKSNGRLDVKNLNERSEDFTLSCALQADGSMTFTQYSIDGYTYEGNDGGIFTFKVTSAANVSAGTYSMALTNVVLSIDGKAYEQPDSYGSILADCIGTVESGELKAESCWFTLDGRKLDKPQRGISIIRYSNGTTRKALVK